MQIYQDFLKLSNPHLQAFIKSIFPATTFSNSFCYDTFKNSLETGTFGEIFYSQIDPVPLACPQIKKLSEDLDAKIASINSFKYTEEQAQQKISCRLKENLVNQVEKRKL